jgi:hypothetical protein
MTQNTNKYSLDYKIRKYKVEVVPLVFSSSQDSTIYISYDFEKCVLEMLKYLGTDCKTLNQYDPKTKTWKYNPSSSYNSKIYIEEQSINSIQKIIYELCYHNKLQKIIFTTHDSKTTYRIDETFVFSYEPLQKFSLQMTDIDYVNSL